MRTALQYFDTKARSGEIDRLEIIEPAEKAGFAEQKLQKCCDVTAPGMCELQGYTTQTTDADDPKPVRWFHAEVDERGEYRRAGAWPRAQARPSLNAPEAWNFREKWVDVRHIEDLEWQLGPP